MFFKPFASAIDYLAPLFHFALSETSGTAAVDTQVNHPGAYIGTYTLDQPGLIPSDQNDASVDFTSGGIEVPHAADLNITGDYTITAVLAFTGTTYGILFGKFDSTSPWKGPSIFVNYDQGTETAGVITFRQSSTEGVTTATGGLNDGVPRLYTFVRRGLVLEVWIDGILDATHTVAALEEVTDSQPLYIMGRTGDVQVITGQLSDIAYFGQAITADEIDNLHALYLYYGANYKAATLIDEPEAYWRLGELTGITAADEKGNHAGTYEGTYTQGNAGLISGTQDSSVLLDGASGHISTLWAGPQGAIERTYELWMKFSGFDKAVDDAMLGHGSAATGENVAIRINDGVSGASGLLRVEVAGGYRVFDKDIADNKAHYIVVLMGAILGDTRAYVDGVEITAISAEAGLSTVINTTSTYDFAIGTDPVGSTGREFEGAIDEVAIYQHQLTLNQIKWHYLIGRYYGIAFTDHLATDHSPIAYWRLNETVGAIANDIAGTNDGVYPAGVTKNASNPFPSDSTTAAVSFDGGNDANSTIQTPFHLTGRPEFSVAFWVVFKGKPSTVQCLLVDNRAFYPNAWEKFPFAINATTNANGDFSTIQMTLSKGDDYTNDLILETPVDSIKLGEWYFVVANYKENALAELIVNGAIEGSSAITFIISDPATIDFAIGGPGESYGGGIDQAYSNNLEICEVSVSTVMIAEIEAAGLYFSGMQSVPATASISGTITLEGAPEAATVRAYVRSTGEFGGEALSDNGSGAYTISGLQPGVEYDVFVIPGAGIRPAGHGPIIPIEG